MTSGSVVFKQRSFHAELMASFSSAPCQLIFCEARVKKEDFQIITKGETLKNRHADKSRGVASSYTDHIFLATSALIHAARLLFMCRKRKKFVYFSVSVAHEPLHFDETLN
jgi:hypothetical protein